MPDMRRAQHDHPLRVASEVCKSAETGSCVACVRVLAWP
jgi:hypothetical protein